jgi:hypothetical protein
MGLGGKLLAAGSAVLKAGGGNDKKEEDAAPEAAHYKSAYSRPEAFRRGGKVRKSGLARVHKGEVVLTKKQARKRGSK